MLVVKKKIPAADVDLRLQGIESTIIPRRNKVKHEEQTIARARAILKVGNGPGNENRRVIARGVYNLPFEFFLPVSLPSSTQFPKSDTRSFSGRIQYHLHAVIGELRTDRVFYVVSAPLPPTVVPCISQPTTQELKQAKVLKKGFLSFATCVENTRVGKGEAIKISVACRNSSSVDVERVRIKLVELIEYKAQGDTANLKNELQSIKDINLPGLDKSRSKELRMSKRRFSETMATTHRDLLQDLLSGQNQFSVPIPKATTRDTYDGCLIKISHYIKITFVTGSLVDNPSFKLPIVVGTPSGPHQPERAPNEPIATVVMDDTPILSPEMIDPSDESTVEVGSVVAVPMADAMVLDPSPPEQNPNSNSNSSAVSSNGHDDHVAIGAANVFPCDNGVGGGGGDVNNNHSNEILVSMPVPSAPDESLLLEGRVMSQGASNGSGTQHLRSQHISLAHHSHSSQSPAYAPFAMYNSNNNNNNYQDRINTNSSVSGSTVASSYAREPQRSRIDSFSYTDSASGITSSTGGPQLGHAQQILPPNGIGMADRNRMYEQVLSDLRASIHDYEVIAGKLRIPQYRWLFSALTAPEYGMIIQNTSMAHQGKKNSGCRCLLVLQLIG